MTVVSAPCPGCGIPLRRRIDRTNPSAGPCPDCGVFLAIDLAHLEDRPFQVVDAPSAAEPENAKSVKETKSATIDEADSATGARPRAVAGFLTRLAPSSEFLQSPLTLAWVVAVVAVVVVGLFVFRLESERLARQAPAKRTPSGNPVDVVSLPEGPITRGVVDEDPAIQVPLPVLPEVVESTLPSPVSQEEELPLPAADALVPVNQPVPPTPLERRLAQRLLKIQQTSDVPVVRQLFFLEELVGVPIRYDDALRERLEQPVRIELEKSTVGELLTALLKPLGLTWTLNGNELRLEEHAQQDEGQQRL